MKFITLFNSIDRLIVRFAMIMLFIMMVLTTADAFARTVFNSPIIGVLEITERYLMVAIVFLSLSYTMETGGHIRIDLILSKMSKKTSRILEVFSSFLGGVLFFFIGYQGLLSTIEAYTQNYVIVGVVSWPTWTSLVLVPIGSFLLVFRLLVHNVNLIVNSNYETLVNNREESSEFSGGV